MVGIERTLSITEFLVNGVINFDKLTVNAIITSCRRNSACHSVNLLFNTFAQHEL